MTHTIIGALKAMFHNPVMRDVDEAQAGGTGLFSLVRYALLAEQARRAAVRGIEGHALHSMLLSKSRTARRYAVKILYLQMEHGMSPVADIFEVLKTLPPDAADPVLPALYIRLGLYRQAMVAMNLCLAKVSSADPVHGDMRWKMYLINRMHWRLTDALEALMAMHNLHPAEQRVKLHLCLNLLITGWHGADLRHWAERLTVASAPDKINGIILWILFLAKMPEKVLQISFAPTAYPPAIRLILARLFKDAGADARASAFLATLNLDVTTGVGAAAGPEPWLARPAAAQIAEDVYGNIKYMWCAPVYDMRRSLAGLALSGVPANSLPAALAAEYRENVVEWRRAAGAELLALEYNPARYTAWADEHRPLLARVFTEA